MDPVFESRVPTLDEHRELAAAVGWLHHFDFATLPASLEWSLSGVVARVDGELAGMGRLVGDGAHYFYLQDVLVHPDHRAAGIGASIVDLLLEQVARLAPSPAFVGLFSSPEAVALYSSRGFGTEAMIGMHRTVDPAQR